MRVGITGMGVISAIGNDLAATREGLFAPPPLPRLPTRFETSLANPVFEVALPPEDTPPNQNRTCRLLDRALQEALDTADLDTAMLSHTRVGVAIGTTVAVQVNDIPFYAELVSHPDAHTLSPHPIFSHIANCPAEAIQNRFHLHGPALTISNACSSGADAIAIGAWWIEQGQCDIALVGGADELSRVPYIGFNSLGVCSHEPCAPFDANRSGLNLGEAAGVMVLESEASRVRRGRRASCSLAGIGKTSDAHHITQPCSDGREFERAIRLALADAALDPADLAFVNAHGTGTRANDSTEATTFARVFGPRVKFMSTKAMTGHTLGAAGTIEAIFTCLMLEAGRATQSHRFQCPSPEIPVAPLTANTPITGRDALSTSLAFGGSNTALVFHLEEP